MPPIVAHAEGGTLPASALDFLEGRSVTPSPDSREKHIALRNKQVDRWRT
jgi:hypothetical protein